MLLYDDMEKPGGEVRRRLLNTFVQKFTCEYSEKDLEDAVVHGVFDNKVSTEQMQVLIFKDS